MQKPEPLGNLDVNPAFVAVMNTFNEVMPNGKRMAQFVIAGICEETAKKYADMLDISQGNERVKMMPRRVKIV